MSDLKNNNKQKKNVKVNPPNRFFCFLYFCFIPKRFNWQKSCEQKRAAGIKTVDLIMAPEEK